jgi:hypothetical protein
MNGNAYKTHCARGHEFTEANTKWIVSRGVRSCKRCAAYRAKCYRSGHGVPDNKRSEVPRRFTGIKTKPATVDLRAFNGA